MSKHTLRLYGTYLFPIQAETQSQEEENCSAPLQEYNLIRQMLDKQNQDTANNDILLNDVVADETTSYVGAGQSSEHEESAAAPTTTRYQFSTEDETQEFPHSTKSKEPFVRILKLALRIECDRN